MNGFIFARETRWGHALLSWVVTCAFAPTLHAQTDPAFRLVSKEVFLPGRPGVRVVAQAFHVRSRGQEMISRHSEQTKSDKADIAYQRFSGDNGRTWSSPSLLITNEHVSGGSVGPTPSSAHSVSAPVTNESAPGGTRRRAMKPGFVDPTRDVLVTVFQEAILPTDNPLEGMKHWTLHCALSRDGGRTNYHEGPLVHKGTEYSREHPLPNVWVGKNSAMIGDTTCVPIRIRTGEILQPIQITPIGPDGQYHNPGGGYTYHDSAVLIGRWTESGTLDWELSNLVKGDPTRSTRGMLEPTIIEAPDGRILMVLRGSNDRKPNLPGYRWYAVSSDHARSWSPPRPWTYDNNESFHSPSSCSQLLRHSSGRICWIGNICPSNPRGNSPRYPLVVGEVDPESLLLRKKSLLVIEDRRPGEPEWTALSNFYAREDRISGEIVVHLSPIGKGLAQSSRPAVQATQPAFEWTADAWMYRIAVLMAEPRTRE